MCAMIEKLRMSLESTGIVCARGQVGRPLLAREDRQSYPPPSPERDVPLTPTEDADARGTSRRAAGAATAATEGTVAGAAEEGTGEMSAGGGAGERPESRLI